MSKSIISILIILAAGVMLLALTKFGSDKTGNQIETGNIEPSALDKIFAADRVTGNKNASVILIEYSDFQCPACAYYSPILNQLIKEYSQDLALVYRHYPLPQHKNANPAARASEAAGAQDKFWEYKDLLFENQNKWEGEDDPTSLFISYAGALGLNLGQFQADYNSSNTMAKVENDKKSGDSAGIDGTPSFFLNGKKISNPGNIGELRQIVEGAIKNRRQDEASKPGISK